MKAMMKKLFSFSATDARNYKDNLDRIELVSCPLNEMMCKVHLASVKKSYVESEQFRKEKDYYSSIVSLKSAFFKATELMAHPCTKCAQQYRLKVVESMFNIHGELEEISQGIFGNKKYQSSFIKADNVLREFKSKKFYNTVQLKESKDRFLGNFLN